MWSWNPIVSMIHKRTQILPVWKASPLTKDDENHLRQEALEESPFDPKSLRRTMYEGLQNGHTKLISKECSYAKVIVVYETERSSNPSWIPWSFWARIFAAFGPPSSGKWRVIWFAHPSPRLFPPHGQTPGPENVNGGYTYPCRPDTIVLYRKEEASRVLIHEMLHAACTDDMRKSVEIRESETEAWAEIFLIGILAAASKRREATANRLWKIQSQWIADQNLKLRSDYSIHNKNQYVWRYTIGREDLLERLGFQLPSGKHTSICSLRFTSPQLILL